MAELKTLRYAGAAELAYCIEGNICVFCGLSSAETHMSPATAVWQITQQISEVARRVQIRKIAFHELGTHLCWPGVPGGTYEYHRVTFNNGVDPAWESVKCPAWVLALFREYIGGEGEPKRYNPPQNYSLNSLLRRRIAALEI